MAQEPVGLSTNAIIPQPAPEALDIQQIEQILEWIGFADGTQRNRIMNDAFATYDDILTMKDKDVTELSTSFSRRTSANERIDFGIRQTNKLKHLVHWVQDAARTSYKASINKHDLVSILAALNVAGERADVRKQIREKSDVRAKEASPGPLVNENKWSDWEPKFLNYLSTIIGMNGVPLSYITRDNDAPDRESDYPDF